VKPTTAPARGWLATAGARCGSASTAPSSQGRNAAGGEFSLFRPHGPSGLLEPNPLYEVPLASGVCPRKAECGSTTFPYCTLAVTDALAFTANVHVLVLFPPLEQAPDQIASRPFVTLSVTEVPTLNDVDPVLPTFTLMPAGLDSTRSPLRPVAVTVRVAVCPGGFTVNVVVRLTAP
jgi:hypothetical protein